MKVKNMPDIVNILIKIGNNGNIGADNRIIAFDLLKKIKSFEVTFMEARQPIINKYAAKDKNNPKKFKYISYKQGNKIINDYVIPQEVRSLYDLEMKKILEFNLKLEPQALFYEEEISFLPKEDIKKLRNECLIIPLVIN